MTAGSCLRVFAVHRLPAIALGLSLGLLAEEVAAASVRNTIRAVSSPAPVGSAEPRLAVGADGVAMSWFEPRGGSGYRLRCAFRDGDRWSPPATIAEGDSFFVNWADFPSLRWQGGHRWAAHWMWKRGAGTYAYDLRVAFSRDDGRSWSAPVTPHRDDTPTEHGFASLVAEPGGLRAFWLDGRNFFGAPEDVVPGPDMTVRTALLDSMGGLSDELELDARTCDCCATAAVATTQGTVLAYRDRSSEEMRDIAVIRSAGGRWSAPVIVHADGWKIPGCPVNGPAIDAHEDRVVLAWYTAAAETARVLVAWSADAGASFAAPLRIDGGNPAGRVGITMLPDGDAQIVWLENGESDASIRTRRVAMDGRLGPTRVVATTSAARASGFPQVIRSGDALVFAWTEAGNRPRIRLAQLALDDPRLDAGGMR